ncbi:Alkaline phosphatase synthesis sensor protein PhoR [compost metagenome]
MAGIIGNLDYMKQGLAGPLSDEQRHLLERGLRHAEVMRVIIEGLDDLRQAELGKLRLAPRWILAAQLVEEAFFMLRPLADQASVRLVNAIPPDLVTVWGDPVRLGQVLINLLSNALRFTPSGGTVEVGARREARALCMEVRDTGIGIAPEHHAQIFTPYWQGESHHEPGGLGLGLAISKYLVEAHGGQLGVESRPGAGSRFYFILPQDPATGGDPPERGESAAT